MKLENVKTAVLAVLFVTCLIMTGRIMTDLSSGNENNLNAKAQASVPGNISVISPQDYVVSFGGGLHTGVFDESNQKVIWQEASQLISNGTNAGVFSSIDADTWSTVISSRGVMLKMPFHLNEEVLSVITKKEIRKDLIGPFNIFVMPVSEPGRFYIGDTDKGTYLRCDFPPQESGMSEILNRIEKESYTEFRSLESIYSIKSLLNPNKAPNFIENINVIPTLSLQGVEKLSLKNQTASGNVSTEEMRRMAANAFGSDLSFVKKISDVDGSVIYVYGYGEKTLKIGIDGQIEYKKSKGGNDKSDVGFSEALHRVLIVLQAYGELPDTFYLQDYNRVQTDKGPVQTFKFSYRIKGIPFMLKSEKITAPIEVDLTNGEVTDLVKSTWSVNGEIHSLQGEMSPFVNMLDKNFKEFEAAGPPKTKNEDDRHYAYRLLNSIKRVDLMYTLNSGGDMAIGQPVWQIDIGNKTFLVDYYDGTVLEKFPLIKEGNDGLE